MKLTSGFYFTCFFFPWPLNQNLLMRPFRSNNPYKQCLVGWSCVPPYSSYFIEEFLGAEEKAILYSRGLLQV